MVVADNGQARERKEENHGLHHLSPGLRAREATSKRSVGRATQEQDDTGAGCGGSTPSKRATRRCRTLQSICSRQAFSTSQGTGSMLQVRLHAAASGWVALHREVLLASASLRIPFALALSPSLLHATVDYAQPQCVGARRGGARRGAAVGRVPGAALRHGGGAYPEFTTNAATMTKAAVATRAWSRSRREPRLRLCRGIAGGAAGRTPQHWLFAPHAS